MKNYFHMSNGIRIFSQGTVTIYSRISLCRFCHSLFSIQIFAGDGRAVNHEVRKRVVREFGLPDVAVEVLRHAPTETVGDFPVNQESQQRNTKQINQVIQFLVILRVT